MPKLTSAKICLTVGDDDLDSNSKLTYVIYEYIEGTGWLIYADGRFEEYLKEGSYHKHDLQIKNSDITREHLNMCMFQIRIIAFNDGHDKIRASATVEMGFSDGAKSTYSFGSFYIGTHDGLSNGVDRPIVLNKFVADT